MAGLKIIWTSQAKSALKVFSITKKTSLYKELKMLSKNY